jgi:tRNA modification GTPase
MTFDLDDTIAAIATAAGGGLRGIVRVSGPRSMEIAAHLFGGDMSTALPTCRRGTICLPRELGSVPVTLYLWPTTRSYTGQPSAELHLPGSPPLLEAALEAACGAGARLARPGEFTLRAFLVGRLDLTQAEAVLGVIDADSRPQLESALAQLAGGIGRPLRALREQLLDLLAQLEAGLDFVDEDIEFITAADLGRQLVAAAETIESLAQQMQSRGEAAQLPRVVLTGLPNVGKSSLLNALAGEAAAIVSDVAGTTRDFVTRRVRIGQRECLIVDTAGHAFTAATNMVATAAQSLARQQATTADLVLFCLDSTEALNDCEKGQLYGQDDHRTLIVWTKCDLPPSSSLESASPAISTSSRTGVGLDELRRAIERALEPIDSESGVVTGTADRCRESLRLAAEALQRARTSAAAGEELVAAEIRGALDELGRVVGAIYTEDILDRVFSRFCIGK